MPRRQFANMSVVQLEKLFDEKRENGDVLESLLSELGHRTVPRAMDLKRRVIQAISVAKKGRETRRVIKPLSPEDHRFSAEYFLKGQPDWTLAERTEAAALARHLVNLASLMEQRRKGS